MNLGELMDGLSVRALPRPASSGWAALRICDITEDSRTVVPGSLFIARSGVKADGKKFAADAVHAGAVAILTDDDTLDPGPARVPILVSADIQLDTALLAERFYGEGSRLLSLAGVTGTNGKTTITYLIWQLLNNAGNRCGLIGTVVVDDGTEVAPANMTTPPAIEVSRSLARMHEAGCTAAALEVSSHALDQKRADALRFRVGIFTNLTGDHLDYHKSMEQYAAAKSRLFQLLPKGALALVNADDPWSARIVQGTPARILRCGITDASADCRAQVLAESIAGTDFTLTGPWGSITASVPLIGRYNAMNILQATAAAHEMGLTREDLESGLPRLSAPPGRLERVTRADDPVQVFVDYAHSDDSLKNVLAAVAQVMPGRTHRGQRIETAAGATTGSTGGGRLWVVFGCGGDRDRTKRPRMGKAAAEGADVVVVTSDNPRTERPSDIIDQVLTGIDAAHRHKVTVQADRARAIRAAIEGARPGDVVVIAGKGHETEQILPDGQGGTIRTHFDDREVARTVFEEHAPKTPPAAARPVTGSGEVVVPKQKWGRSGSTGQSTRGDGA